MARRIGEKDPEGASKGAVQALYLALGFSLVVSIVGLIWSRDILLLMGADAAMADYGQGYTRIAMGSNVVIVFLFIINGIFRGGPGMRGIAMKSLILASVLNIIALPAADLRLGAAARSRAQRGGHCHPAGPRHRGDLPAVPLAGR